jgi:hypothetical protein
MPVGVEYSSDRVSARPARKGLEDSRRILEKAVVHENWSGRSENHKNGLEPAPASLNPISESFPIDTGEPGADRADFRASRAPTPQANISRKSLR